MFVKGKQNPDDIETFNLHVFFFIFMTDTLEH